MSDLSENQTMPFAAYQHMLRERLHYFIDALDPLLKRDVQSALEQRGKLLCLSSDTALSSFPNGMWALLPWLVAKDLKPSIDSTAACTVAIAIEFLICALDLLDDIEDGDKTPIVLQLGTARTLNVSTTLLLLTQSALLSLTELGIPSERILALIKILQGTTLSAAIGQHGDIVGEQQEIEQYTYDDCIRIARGKAGSLMHLACTIGCVFVGMDEQVCQFFAELGELLGIAHQLDNDGHDLYAIIHVLSLEQVKTDLERQKKTLPLVLAAQARASQQQNTVDTSPILEADRQQLFLDSLNEGIIATWGISLLYREHAREQLQKIEAHYPLSHELRLLLGFA